MRAPHREVGPVQVLPERLPVPTRWGIGAGRSGGAGERGEQLFDKRSRGADAGRREIEPYVHGQEIGLPEGWKESGLEQRGLAKTRATEEDRERRFDDEAPELGNLALTAVEELRRALVEPREPGPRVLGIQPVGCARRVRGQGVTPRNARSSRTIVASSFGVSLPLGAKPKSSVPKRRLARA